MTSHSFASITKTAPMFSSRTDNKRDFATDWPYCSVVSKELGAKSWEADPSSPRRTYKSGRPVLVATFFNAAGEVIETRDAMSLKSTKTGNDYVVCMGTAAIAERAERAAAGRDPATGQFDLSDVLP